MKKLRPLPPLPMGVCSSSSQLRTRFNEPPIECVSQSSPAPHPPHGKHCTNAGYDAPGRHPAKAPGPGGQVCARKASPSYPPLCEVTSFPWSGGCVRASLRCMKLRPHGPQAPPPREDDLQKGQIIPLLAHPNQPASATSVTSAAQVQPFQESRVRGRARD